MEVVKEYIWLKYLANELIFDQKRFMVHCDNQEEIYLTKNLQFQDHINYVDVKLHFVQQMTEQDE